MTLDEFQDLAKRTRGTERTNELAILALGLTGEAGEVADLIKKHLGHGHELDRTKVIKELGDVLWYLALLATHHGVALSDVAKMNVDKLNARYPNGFSTEASKFRPCDSCGGAYPGHIATCLVTR